jgi:hypothetical protein
MKSAVEKFMKCTGNYRTLNSKEDLFVEVNKLIPLIQEELDELRESLKLRWVEGVLDDCLDLKVYNHQLQSLLERLGCLVVPAEEAVDVNNSLKGNIKHNHCNLVYLVLFICALQKQRVLIITA